MIRPIGFLVSLSLVSLACASASGPSLDPARTNCNVVCQKAHDCVNGNSNVDSCTSNCANKSSDTSYKDKVQQCADCVQPKACSQAASCTGDCFNLIVSS